MIDGPDLAYTIPEAAKLAKLSKATIYRRAAEGQLKLVHVGARTLVRRAELEAFLASCEDKAA